jgi:hypothetical protein
VCRSRARNAPRACTEFRFDRCARSRKCGRASARSGHVGRSARDLSYGPIGSLLPVWRRDFGPPPVSLSLLTLVGSVRSKSGCPPGTRMRRRPVVRTTRRWRR